MRSASSIAARSSGNAACARARTGCGISIGRRDDPSRSDALLLVDSSSWCTHLMRRVTFARADAAGDGSPMAGTRGLEPPTTTESGKKSVVPDAFLCRLERSRNVESVSIATDGQQIGQHSFGVLRA
jgi:hypothetical protein